MPADPKRIAVALVAGACVVIATWVMIDRDSTPSTSQHSRESSDRAGLSVDQRPVSAQPDSSRLGSPITEEECASLRTNDQPAKLVSLQQYVASMARFHGDVNNAMDIFQGDEMRQLKERLNSDAEQVNESRSSGASTESIRPKESQFALDEKVTSSRVHLLFSQALVFFDDATTALKDATREGCVLGRPSSATDEAWTVLDSTKEKAKQVIAEADKFESNADSPVSDVNR